MLCGQFLSGATIAASPHYRLCVPLATAATVSTPYYTLLSLYSMAALTANHHNVDDEDIFMGKPKNRIDAY